MYGIWVDICVINKPKATIIIIWALHVHEYECEHYSFVDVYVNCNTWEWAFVIETCSFQMK
jgi:hypothetical protein